MAGNKCLAKFNYQAVDGEELTITKGEVLIVVDDKGTWWKVRNQVGRMGLVPSNYVEIMKSGPVSTGQASNARTNLQFDEHPNQYQQPDLMVTRNGPSLNIRCIAKFKYVSTREDELSLEKGDEVIVMEKETDGWWRGRCGTKIGWFPFNYVEEAPKQPANTSAAAAAPPEAMQQPGPSAVPPSKQHKSFICGVIALYSFISGNPVELPFEKGDLMDIIDQLPDDPDWWVARTIDGTTGLVPRNYVEIVHDAEPVFRPIVYESETKVNKPFNVGNVLLELKEVGNWRDVVLHLRVPRRIVDHIEKSYRGTEEQKREAILWWMKNSVTASWKELADALFQADYSLLSTRVMLNQESKNELSAESLEFCANVEKHLKRSGAVNRFLANIVFVGLPGSGKTTLIARLLNLKGVDEMLKASASTGVMNGIITVDVAEDKASIHAASHDKNFEWHGVEFGLSCLRQMGEQSFMFKLTCEESSKVADSANSPEGMGQEIMPKLLHSAKQRPVEQAKTKNSPSIMEAIQKELLINGFSAVRPFLDNKSSLYLSDTGGQIEFQELLPLLVAGCAIFVFLFPLNIDLDAPVTVSYRKKVGDEVECSNVYKSTLTIRESFLQTLASIDSMEGIPNPSIAKHNPFVFVVGTHKDCLVKALGEDEAVKEITAINGKVKSLIKEHQYEDLVVYADKAKDEVLFAVDNTCKNAVFQKIRSCVTELIHSCDQFRIQFPLSYLLASLHLQDSSKPFIKRSDFTEYVLPYGIEEGDIDHLLQFLHTRIGQIRHFPLEGIKEVIVKEPQALYNLVTFLIIKSFISQSITMKEYSEVQRGIYSLESFDIEEFLSQSLGSIASEELTEFLTPKQVIHLLKELRIVAPFYDRAAGVEKYFIPCVLNHLQQKPEEKSSMSTVQSLAVIFERGHCPKGLFGVLLHCILTQDMKQLNWSLDIEKIFRGQVSFEVGPYDDEVTVKFHTTHLEVECFPADVQQRNPAFTTKNICNLVRCAIGSGIEQSIESLHYSKEKTEYSLGLVCAECNKGHKVTAVETQQILKCPQGTCPVPDPGSFWFGIPPTYSFHGNSGLVCLREGSDHQLVFDVFSDPPLESPSQHQLSREGPLHPRVSLEYGTTVVQFKQVRKADEGKYTICASNAAGRGTITFHLKIKHPLQYSLETDYLEAEAGSSPTVTFTVTSDPPLNKNTKHTLSKSDGSPVTKRFKVESSQITFRKVRMEDSGTYIISCRSDEGEEIQETLELEVTPFVQLPAQSMQSGTVVRSGDVNLLMGLLHKCAYKWREIGAALNFHYGELENISTPNPLAPPQQLLTKLLTQWSQWPTSDHPNPPTLERLRDALRSGQVGLGAEANILFELRDCLPSRQK